MALGSLGSTELRLGHHSCGQSRPAEPRPAFTDPGLLSVLPMAHTQLMNKVNTSRYLGCFTPFCWLELKSRAHSCLQMKLRTFSYESIRLRKLI